MKLRQEKKKNGNESLVLKNVNENIDNNNINDTNLTLNMYVNKTHFLQSDYDKMIGKLFNISFSYSLQSKKPVGSNSFFSLLFIFLSRGLKALFRANHDAETDELTQLLNRRAFTKHLEATQLEAEKTGFSVSALFIDIDHFKRINDAFGHDIGDLTLRALAKLIRECSPGPFAKICRWGGEEIVLLLPRSSSEDARKIADTILKSVRKMRIDVYGREVISATVSIGIATYDPNVANPDFNLIDAADTRA